MKLKEGFKLRQVCDENVVTAEGMQAIDFSKMISLNATAAFLWQEAEKQGDFTAQTLAKALCGEYDVDETRAEKDCLAIINQWAEGGLIE